MQDLKNLTVVFLFPSHLYLSYWCYFAIFHDWQIWAHIEALDSQVFAEDVHPLFRKAAYAG